jgi:hypothetical protein
MCKRLILVLTLVACFAAGASAQTKLGIGGKPETGKPGDGDSIDPKQHMAFCKELKAEETHLEALLSAHSKHKSSCTDVKSPIKTAKGSCSTRATALDRCLSMTLTEIKSEWTEHKCSQAGTILKKP